MKYCSFNSNFQNKGLSFTIIKPSHNKHSIYTEYCETQLIYEAELVCKIMETLINKYLHTSKILKRPLYNKPLIFENVRVRTCAYMPFNRQLFSRALIHITKLAFSSLVCSTFALNPGIHSLSFSLFRFIEETEWNHACVFRIAIV